MSHGPHTGGKKRRNVVDIGHIGAGDPCAYDGCDHAGREATITDRSGSRRVYVCDDHFGNWAARLANQGAECRR